MADDSSETHFPGGKAETRKDLCIKLYKTDSEEQKEKIRGDLRKIRKEFQGPLDREKEKFIKFFVERLLDKASYGIIKFCDDKESVPYIRVPWDDEDKAKFGSLTAQERYDLKAQVVLHFIEQVWNLERPRLVVSVTGGAQDFYMGDEKDRLLSELMEMTRSTNGWIITAGSNVGIMKYVGEARNRYGGNIPLLSIVSLGAVKGLDKKMFESDDAKLGSIKYEPGDGGNKTVILDSNHSHIIFVDDGTEDLGSEISFRAHFIAHARLAKGHNDDVVVSEQFLSVAGIESETCAPTTAAKMVKFDSQSPSICICFEGGPNTIKTAAEAVKTHTPLLLIKGSGRAADLIADLNCIASTYWDQTSNELQSEEAFKLLKKSVADVVLSDWFVQRLVAAVRFLDQMKSYAMTTAGATAGNQESEKDLRVAFLKDLAFGEELLGLYGLALYDSRPGSTKSPEKAFELLQALYCVAKSRLVSVYNINALPTMDRLDDRDSLFDAAFYAFRKAMHRVSLRKIFFAKLKRNIPDRSKNPTKAVPSLRDLSSVRRLSLLLEGQQPAADSSQEMTALEKRMLRMEIGSMMRQIDTDRPRQELLLMIEWNRHKLIRAWLQRMCEGDASSASLKLLLNPGFHNSLMYNRSEIACTFLSLGADITLYSDTGIEESVALTISRARSVAQLKTVTRSPQPEAERKDATRRFKFEELMICSLQSLEKEYYMHLEGMKATLKCSANNMNSEAKAKDFLDKMYQKFLEPHGKFSFESLSTELHLFMLMIVTNRPQLAELLWRRQARENSEIILELSLVACLLCRTLSEKYPCKRVEKSLNQTADFYGKFVKLVLLKFSEANSEIAFRWIINDYRPTTFSKNLSIIDLIVKGRCEGIIEGCHTLCIDAVQNQFSGNDLLCCFFRDNFNRVINSVAGEGAVKWTKGLLQHLEIESRITSNFNFPMDDTFFLEVIAHGIHTSFLSALLFTGTSSYSLALEAVVLLFFIIDQVMDVVLLGIDLSEDRKDKAPDDKKESVSLREVVEKGLPRYFADPFSGEFFEFWAMVCFLAGLVARHGEWGSIAFAFTASVIVCAVTTYTRAEHASTFWIRCLLVPSIVVSFLALLLHAAYSGFKHTWNSDKTHEFIAYTFYGMSVGIMWLRVMHFFVVQRKLGQFVRVMVSMGQDLGLFALAWVVLIVAFATMMLGAEMGSNTLRLDAAQCQGSGSDSKSGPAPHVCNLPVSPVEKWQTWFLLRTYLQSIGSDQFEEMDTAAKVAIFVFMYPIFNVLMVNLLVAIMSERYEEAKKRSVVLYCFMLYAAGQNYRQNVHTNAISLLWHFVSYLPKVEISRSPVKMLTQFKLFVMETKTRKRPLEAVTSTTPPSPPKEGQQQCSTLVKGFAESMKRSGEKAGEYRRVKDMILELVSEALTEMLGQPDALSISEDLGRKVQAVTDEVKLLQHFSAISYRQISEALEIDDDPKELEASSQSPPVDNASTDTQSVDVTKWKGVKPLRHFVAILEVKVHGASNLKGRIFGTRDSYLKLRLNDQEVRTATMENTQKPQWNETFTLLVQHSSNQKLYAEVLQDEWVIKDMVDCRIGSCDVPLREIMQGRTRGQRLQVPLGAEDCGLGWLNVTLDYEELPQHANLTSHAKSADEVAEALHARFGEPMKVKWDMQGVSNLKPGYKGLLQVLVVRGKDFSKLGEAVVRTFVHMELDKQTEVTQMYPAGGEHTDPEWKEYAEFMVTAPETQKLKVCIMSHSKGAGDKVLAWAEVPVEDKTRSSGVHQPLSLPLKRRGAAGGGDTLVETGASVELEVHFARFEVTRK